MKRRLLYILAEIPVLCRLVEWLGPKWELYDNRSDWWAMAKSKHGMYELLRDKRIESEERYRGMGFLRQDIKAANELCEDLSAGLRAFEEKSQKLEDENDCLTNQIEELLTELSKVEQNAVSRSRRWQCFCGVMQPHYLMFCSKCRKVRPSPVPAQ